MPTCTDGIGSACVEGVVCDAWRVHAASTSTKGKRRIKRIEPTAKFLCLRADADTSRVDATSDPPRGWCPDRRGVRDVALGRQRPGYLQDLGDDRGSAAHRDAEAGGHPEGAAEAAARSDDAGRRPLRGAPLGRLARAADDP